MKKPSYLVERSFLYICYFCVLFPLIILALWSISGRWPFPDLLPMGLSMRGIEELFGAHSKVLAVLGSSIVLSVVVALLSVAVSLPAARAIVLTDFRGKEFLKFVVFMPVIVPATAFAMGVHTFFIGVHLNDTIAAVIIVHVILCLPYTIRILVEVVEATGDRLEMQARNLGASPLKTLLSITLPNISPGIISSACMAFIVSFSQYFVTLLIGGGSVLTYAMVMFPYIGAGDRVISGAYGLLFVISTVLVFVVFERIVKKYYDVDDIVFFG